MVILSALLIGSVLTASARSGTVDRDGPDVPTAWVVGPSTMFPSVEGGYSRFDGEYYPPNGRVYFLGGREGADGDQNEKEKDEAVHSGDDFG